jgi:hypothetical protein
MLRKLAALQFQRSVDPDSSAQQESASSFWWRRSRVHVALAKAKNLAQIEKKLILG